MMRRVFNFLAGLVVVGGIVALIWLAVIQPLQTRKGEILLARADTSADLARTNESIARLMAERAGLADESALDVVWSAPQMGEATARIQSKLSEIATKRGIALRSVTPTGQQQLSLSQAAGFRIEFEAALDQLSGFLAEIEYHKPVLVIERASLRRLNRPASRAETSVFHAQPLVFAQLDLLAPVLQRANSQ